MRYLDIPVCASNNCQFAVCIRALENHRTVSRSEYEQRILLFALNQEKDAILNYDIRNITLATIKTNLTKNQNNIHVDEIAP